MIEMLVTYGFFATLGCFIAGALLSIILSGRGAEKDSWLFAHALAVFGGLLGLAYGTAVLISGEAVTIQIGGALGFGSNILDFRIDGLAAFFFAFISGASVAASLFGAGSLKHFLGAYRLGAFGFFYNVFIGGMLVVVSADNALLFLFGWEIMAIASYFLVIFERKREENVRAGVLYILISQLGATFLLAAFLLLYRFIGSWDFDTIRASIDLVPPLWQNTILALALVGLASKAGVIPLHIWLPEAHPAAPSHVSALMSGVMVKTAIFMIIRFFIEFFPTPHMHWGLLLIALGAVSSLLGVLYALSEHDIKRLLAFHSVENIGIILLGIGAAVTFFSLGIPVAGVVALAAALYHTVNHALFKGLLFLSAGSVVHATHTRNMEEYGGLIKVMPWTAAFFLIGAFAISGLPPLNGFVSEWLTFQSLFAGIALLPLLPKIVFLAGASSLVFTGGLAAACFVKAFGTTFLARPRSSAREHAHESSLIILVSMGILAAFVVIFGLAASSITPVLAHIAEGVRGLAENPVPLVSPAQTIGLGGFSALSMLGVAAALGLGILLAYIITSLTSGRQKVTVSRTWNCGTPLTSRMEITATSFSRSLITIFRRVLRPTMQSEVEYHDAVSRYFTKSKAVHLSLPDLYRMYLYGPATALIERGANKAKRIQTGNLNTYLLYMFLTLMLLLLWALK